MAKIIDFYRPANFGNSSGHCLSGNWEKSSSFVRRRRDQLRCRVTPLRIGEEI